MERGRLVTCPSCNGTGKVVHNTVHSFGVKPCQQCKGKGLIMVVPKRKSPLDLIR